jgi:thiosulfate/3-mercaptopyruvate sulfurtransferase
MTTERYTTLIAAADLAALIDEGKVAVFDCSFDLTAPDSGFEAYAKGHIPGARYLHLDNDLSAPMSGTNGRHPLPSVEQFAVTLRRLGVSEARQVVAYDRSGGPYAARLWWLMRWLGHANVAVLDGGLAAWTAQGGVLTSAIIEEPSGNFVGRPRDGAVIAASEIVDALPGGSLTLVDGRSPERFRGDPHLFDPVSGHIPGARNRFFQHNLKADGSWKTAHELAGELSHVLAGAGDVVLYCGSGVTACHNALAMAYAGLEPARLYAGSWSEWIADPARPVETGTGG